VDKFWSYIGAHNILFIRSRVSHQNPLQQRQSDSIVKLGDKKTHGNTCFDILESMRRVSGEKHRNTLNCMKALAEVQFNQSKWNEAEKLLQSGLELEKPVFGEESSFTMHTTIKLAHAWKA
jgi:hypothetical protein